MEVATSIREDDGKTQVTVEMSAEEVKKHVDAFFKDLAKNRIPGFRPGKAPRKVLEQNFGGHDYIYAQITSDMVNEVAPLATDQQDVVFISDPEFGDEELSSVKDGEGYTFSFYGTVKPVVELSSYEPVEIEMPSEEATDAEVDAQLAALQEYYYNFEDVDRAAEHGDYVMADLKSTVDGKDVEGLNSTNRLIELDAGLLPACITDQLVGMKAEETKEFDVTIEDDDDYAYLEGKPVHVVATVNAVRVRKAPELDDAFAEQVGFDSLDKLRDEIREEITSQKKNQLPGYKERLCVEKLAARIEGEVSDEYVNFSREDILRDFFNQLNRQGVTFDQFLNQQGITADDFQKDLDVQAKEDAEQSLALDALFNELGLEVTEEDVDKEFSFAEDPAATRKSWEEAGRMSVIREALRRQKATQWLVDNAVVTIVDAGEQTKEDAAE